jgi:hypothetical protein
MNDFDRKVREFLRNYDTHRVSTGEFPFNRVTPVPPDEELNRLRNKDKEFMGFVPWMDGWKVTGEYLHRIQLDKAPYDPVIAGESAADRANDIIRNMMRVV